MELFTLPEVAEKLGKNRGSLHRVAVRLGVGMRVGRGLVFTPAEVETLRKNLRPRGCPKFVPGNYFGKPPKKSPKKQK